MSACIVNRKSVTRLWRYVTGPGAETLTQSVATDYRVSGDNSSDVPEGARIESRSEHRYPGVIFLSRSSGMSEKCLKLGPDRFRLPPLKLLTGKPPYCVIYRPTE
jgi:hypothetical protein